MGVTLKISVKLEVEFKFGQEIPERTLNFLGEKI